MQKLPLGHRWKERHLWPLEPSFSTLSWLLLLISLRFTWTSTFKSHWHDKPLTSFWRTLAFYCYFDFVCKESPWSVGWKKKPRQLFNKANVVIIKNCDYEFMTINFNSIWKNDKNYFLHIKIDLRTLLDFMGSLEMGKYLLRQFYEDRNANFW